MVVCSVMLLVSIGINGWALESLSINPMIGPSVLTLIKLGAKDSILIVQKYELWRLIAPMVLHAGLVHYFLNMSALWFVGAALEKAHGHWSLLLVFAVSGIGGTIASSIFLPKFISVGASGGIFGLIGACLADICLNWSILFNQALAGKSIIRHGLIVLVLFFDILLNAVIGLTPLLDNFQHLTGMVLGFLCGISTIKRVSTNFLGEFQQWGFFQRTKQLFRIYFGLVLSLFAIIGGIVLLMNGDGVTSPCPGCSVISCVEFPPWVSYNNRWWHCDDCSTVTAVVSMTSLQMNMTCPSGQNVTFPLHDDYMNVDFLKKNLVSVCRNVCLKKH
jgi:membrane associated rhomboid family serine protease